MLLKNQAHTRILLTKKFTTTNYFINKIMQSTLQIKPYQKDDRKVKVIQLTDITFHTSHKRPTKHIGNKIKKAFDENKSGRFYEPLKNDQLESIEDNKIKMQSNILDYVMHDPDMLEYIKKEEAKGYKIVIELPKDGLPVLIGKDTQEFIESKKGKRILRRLDKKQNIDKI